MGFYVFFRISSLLIPLVNLTDLCKKFGTRWHTCAKTCAKSTIFQICLYETKLNGNNLNYIYNFHKFKLFPIVSVLLISIWTCCSYFPMQNLTNISVRIKKRCKFFQLMKQENVYTETWEKQMFWRPIFTSRCKWIYPSM